MTRMLHGIIPPLVTPLTQAGGLDVGGLERLVEHVIAGGVHGIFVLGSTGEGPSLGRRMRGEVIDQTCKLVRRRVPVIVGITDTSAAESLELARRAVWAGAQAAVLSTPYYYPMSQDELVGYIERIVPQVPLPVLLYHIPQLTKVRMEPQTLRRATQLEQIIGIKDSSNEPAYLDGVLAIARQRPDWSVLVGAEGLLPEAVAKGGHGGVIGGANLAPRLYVDLHKASTSGDAGRIADLRQRVAALSQAYRSGPQLSDGIRGLKTSLSLLGICEDAMAEPFTPLAPAKRAGLREAMHNLGLL